MKSGIVTYPAVFKRDEDTGRVTIIFPDVPGAISEAASVAVAPERAAEALALMLYDEPNLPARATVGETQRAYPNDVVRLVTVDLTQAGQTVTKLT